MSLCGTICFALKSYTTSLIGMSAHISAEFVKKNSRGSLFGSPCTLPQYWSIIEQYDGGRHSAEAPLVSNVL